jgi:ER lumen protein retaining receptor
LYLIVYLARYLDLFTTIYSFYNSLVKIFYIVSTASIVRILRCSEAAQSTYSPAHDSFEHWKYLLIPSVIIGFLTHLIGSGYEDFDYMECLWTISIYLESVTMLPQLIMFRSDRFVKENRGDARDEILLPIFLFGIHRGFYILNWIYRANTERNYRHHWVVFFCGCLQVLLYSQFFRM